MAKKKSHQEILGRPTNGRSKSKVSSRHAHGCMRCKNRYEDTCGDTHEDGFCELCLTKGERELPWWPETYFPRDCCVDARRLDPDRDRDLLVRYHLAGLYPWYRCAKCARTIPYDPSKEYRPPQTIAEWRARYPHLTKEKQ